MQVKGSRKRTCQCKLWKLQAGAYCGAPRRQSAIAQLSRRQGALRTSAPRPPSLPLLLHHPGMPSHCRSSYSGSAMIQAAVIDPGKWHYIISIQMMTPCCAGRKHLGCAQPPSQAPWWRQAHPFRRRGRRPSTLISLLQGFKQPTAARQPGSSMQMQGWLTPARHCQTRLTGLHSCNL